jgi:hypothetical protein
VQPLVRQPVLVPLRLLDPWSVQVVVPVQERFAVPVTVPVPVLVPVSVSVPTPGGLWQGRVRALVVLVPS